MILSMNSCSTSKKVTGKYVGGGYEFQFYKKDSFLFYDKLENGISAYSEGNYLIGRKSIFLVCDRDDLSEIPSYFEESKTNDPGQSIVIDPELPRTLEGETFIKIDLLINGKKYLDINKRDTIFYKDEISTLQTRAYISGIIFSGIPTIDTLYSKVFNVKETNNFFLMKFNVNPNWFFSVKIKDSIRIVSKRKLVFRNSVLKQEAL